MGVKSFQIVFENNKQVFVSGEFINGHILIDFSEPQKARSKLKIINHILSCLVPSAQIVVCGCRGRVHLAGMGLRALDGKAFVWLGKEQKNAHSSLQCARSVLPTHHSTVGAR